MTREEILKFLKSMKKNGIYTNISYKSFIKGDKNHKDTVVQKTTKGIIRLGITYSHIDAPEVKVSDTTSGEQRELPWGEWDPECPYLINHKGRTYLRCATSRAPNHHSQTNFAIDGVVVSKEDAMAVTRPSDWNKKPDIVVFTLPIENIISLGKND